MNAPDALVFDAAGTQVTALPNGYGEFDRESRLISFRGAWGPTRQLAIVDLDTAHVTWLDRPYWSAIVYE